MRRIVFALLAAALVLAVVAAPATASCLACFEGVSLQTPDGLPWSSGKPVTVVVTARAAADVALPQTGLIVVMNTDGDRTKCLDVPLRLVRSEGGGAVYAGIFYPFRAAAYDGKLSFGDETFPITFDVHRVVASTPVAAPNELPVGSTEEPYGFIVPFDIAGPALISGALALFALIGALAYRRRGPVVAAA